MYVPSIEVNIPGKAFWIVSISEVKWKTDGRQIGSERKNNENEGGGGVSRGDLLIVAWQQHISPASLVFTQFAGFYLWTISSAIVPKCMGCRDACCLCQFPRDVFFLSHPMPLKSSLLCVDGGCRGGGGGWGAGVGKEARVTQACIYKTKRGMGLVAGVWVRGVLEHGAWGMGASMKRETGSARTDEIPLPRSSRAWQQFWPPIANISISISICRKLKFPGKTRPLQVAQFRGSDSLFAPHFTGFLFFFPFWILSEFEFRNATSAENQPASQSHMAAHRLPRAATLRVAHIEYVLLSTLTSIRAPSQMLPLLSQIILPSLFDQMGL